jgi:hypothetical protein
MRRVECAIFENQFFFAPAIGIVRHSDSGYLYRYRLALAWLSFGVSIGFLKWGRYR